MSGRADRPAVYGPYETEQQATAAVAAAYERSGRPWLEAPWPKRTMPDLTAQTLCATTADLSTCCRTSHRRPPLGRALS
jgi:hypothetical protein